MFQNFHWEQGFEMSESLKERKRISGGAKYST
jgi:hypothetical protein